jgi:hypothetical protein
MTAIFLEEQTSKIEIDFAADSGESAPCVTENT